MQTLNPERLIEISSELRPFCREWTNALIGGQYVLPYKIVGKYLSRLNGMKILDWGCGDGHFSYLLADMEFHIHAYSFVDVGPVRSLLEKKLPKKFEFLQPENPHPIQIPYENAAFDAVFSMGVLEHVRETGGSDLGSLQEIYRILKPGGYCFVFHLPNKYSWIEKMGRLCVKYGLTKRYTHNFLYNKKDIQLLANQSGFDLVEARLYRFFPRNIFRNFPTILTNNKVVIRAFEFFDNIFSFVLKPFSQNYFVILRKP